MSVVVLHRRRVQELRCVLRLQVIHSEILGADTLVYGHFGADQTLLTLRLPDVHHFARNTLLPLTVPASRLHLFDRESGRRVAC